MALFAGLVLSLPVVTFPSQPAKAEPQSQSRSQSQSREELYSKCAQAVFRKYGQPGVQYNAGERYRVLPITSIAQVDQCVANGGRVD
jgi:hypothetical protein